MDTNLYMNFIKTTIRNEDMRTADIANKIALEQKKITIDQYLAAARIIADEILSR